MKIETFSDISLKLLILKDCNQNSIFFPDDYWHKQNPAMITYKMLGNMDKTFSSRLAGFGH